MKPVFRFRTIYFIIFVWSIYILYFVLYKSPFLLPTYSINTFTAPILQVLMVIVFRLIFKEKYNEIINVTLILSCFISILWHYSIYGLRVPRYEIAIMFVANPLLSTIISYFIQRNKEYTLLKTIIEFVLAIMLNVLNLILMFFIFLLIDLYIF